jgi:hypothetical protein
MSSIFCASSIVRGAAVAKRKGDRSPGFIEPCLATLRESGPRGDPPAVSNTR